jgi:hypothetical protein
MGLHPGVFLKAENGLCIKLVFIYFQPYTFRQTTQNPRRSLFQPVGHASVVSGMIASGTRLQTLFIRWIRITGSFADELILKWSTAMVYPALQVLLN